MGHDFRCCDRCGVTITPETGDAFVRITRATTMTAWRVCGGCADVLRDAMLNGGVTRP